MRPRLIILAATIFISYAYFYQAGGWNQNSRFDLTRAIVEEGTLRIDSFHENTGDKARFDGHVYLDKAPGASLAAVPAVAVARTALVQTGHGSTSPETAIRLSYVATVATAAVPATIACLCVFAFVRRIGATDDVAAAVALIYGLSTPIWAYATLFWGHAMAASCLIVALFAADVLRTSERRLTLLGAALGFSAGFAVVTEFPSAIPAAIIAGLALWTAWSSGWRRLLTVGGGLLAGAGLAAAILLSYQWAAFGSPFHLGYASEEDPQLLQAGFFGITTPKISVMGELLWGAFRGLLPLAPVLIAAPVGLWMLRRSAMKWTIAAAVASAIFYLLLNSAYQNWGGGWTYGPRHLAPALAFLCIGLGPVLMRGGRFVRGIILILAVVGAAESLIAVSTTAQPPPDYEQPMQQLLWPSFRDGKLSINMQSVLEYQPGGSTASWNLGQVAGLTGKASLLPLFACWVIAAFAWMRIERPAALVTKKAAPGRTRRPK